jgi:hypothetical protein
VNKEAPTGEARTAPVIAHNEEDPQGSSSFTMIPPTAMGGRTAALFYLRSRWLLCSPVPHPL